MTEEQDKDIFVPSMPVVPDTWEVLPFVKAAKTASDRGKKIKKKDYLQEGKIPVIDQGQEFIGGYTDDDAMAFDGELPVILFGDHTRAFKYVDKPFAVGADGIKILKPSPDYDPKFFYYLLRSLQIPSRGYSRHFQFLKKFHLPLAPREQQKRIVAEIEKQFSRLDEAVANLKRVKANLKRYKAAVLKAAVEGKLTEEWRAAQGRASVAGGQEPGATKAHPDVEPASKLLDRILAERRAKWEEAELAKMEAKGKAPKNDKWKAKYKEPIEPDSTDLPELPEGWLWATVESLSLKVTDGVHKKPSYVVEGIPFVTVRNLTAGEGISFADLNYVTPEDHAEFCKRTHPERGDILISKDGTLGVVRLIETDRVFSIFVSVALVKPVSYDLSRYLVTAFESPVVQRQMVPKGSGLQHIHLEDLRADCIPVPPLAEQHRIVAEVDRYLSLIRETETQVETNLQRAERLRQSILGRAFSGVSGMANFDVREFARYSTGTRAK